MGLEKKHLQHIIARSDQVNFILPMFRVWLEAPVCIWLLTFRSFGGDYIMVLIKVAGLMRSYDNVNGFIRA